MLALALALVASAQDAAPEFTKCDVAREKTFQKTTAEMALQNPLGPALKNVRLTIIFYDRDLELKRSEPAVVGDLASGGKATATIVTLRVPKFNRFDVRLDHDGGRIFYEANADHPVPVLKKAPPANLSIQLRPPARPASFPADLRFTAVVKNAGEGEAREPTAVIGFLGGPAKQVRVHLAEKIEPGAQDTFEVFIPECPEFRSVETSIVWLDEVLRFPPGRLTNALEVQLGRLRLGRLSDGCLIATGAVRNGIPSTIGQIEIVYELEGRQHPCKVPGNIAAAEVRPFRFFIDDAAPKITRYGYSVGFSELPGKTASTYPPIAAARRVEHKAGVVKIEIAAKPVEEESKAEFLSDAPKGPPVTVELKGLGWVEGYYLKNGDYTGDVAFLGVVIRDDKGELIQPTGSVVATLYNGNKLIKRATRPIQKAAWSRDANRMHSKNVSDTAVAWDAKKKMLWVGLARTAGNTDALRADIKVDLKRVGVWRWKGLKGREFQRPPRGPDPK